MRNMPLRKTQPVQDRNVHRGRVQQLASTFSDTLPLETEMLQQKRNYVAAFGYAVDGSMERLTRIYRK